MLGVSPSYEFCVEPAGILLPLSKREQHGFHTLPVRLQCSLGAFTESLLRADYLSTDVLVLNALAANGLPGRLKNLHSMEHLQWSRRQLVEHGLPVAPAARSAAQREKSEVEPQEAGAAHLRGSSPLAGGAPAVEERVGRLSAVVDVVVSFLVLHWLLSSATAIVLRILVTSGSAFMFLLFRCIRRCIWESLPQLDTILRMSYPWCVPARRTRAAGVVAARLVAAAVRHGGAVSTA